ncbi:spermatogenesis-associated protein 2-like protein, partial [Melospiza melodia melodia]|uniref:spermatogenesis-associated protein 2-like protein n=1 Tax=Melospiza melodia melodia TaxID=1914991 RepID=UPI002FD14495
GLTLPFPQDVCGLGAAAGAAAGLRAGIAAGVPPGVPPLSAAGARPRRDLPRPRRGGAAAAAAAAGAGAAGGAARGRPGTAGPGAAGPPRPRAGAARPGRRLPAAGAGGRQPLPLPVAPGVRQHPGEAPRWRGDGVGVPRHPQPRSPLSLQTFSGAYVHLLRPALPEADLLRSLGRLGYERRERHRLAVGRLPPGPALIAAAVGFLACRLECEILAERALQLRQPRAEELLEARHRAGSAKGWLEMLQDLGTQRRVAPDCGDSVDLYQERPDSPEDTGSKDTAPPALWRDPQDMPARGWGRCNSTLGPEPAGSADPDTSSHLFPQPELVGTGTSPQVLGEPRDSPQAAPELPCYQLHSCLQRGMLPSYCCSTCRQLHGGGCALGRACRSQHRGQELHGERQQRLWLQRSELDMLLARGSVPPS